MPDLSKIITDDVAALKKAYEGISRSWYRRWFFPSALAKALNDYHPEIANAPLLPIVSAMWQNVSSFHKWLFPSIATFSASTLVQQASFLQRPYFHYLAASDIVKTNFNEVIRHKKPHHLAQALFSIYKTGLLSTEQRQANYSAVTQHSNPYGLAAVLLRLHRTTGLLNAETEQGQANREALSQLNNPISLDNFIARLNRGGLITQDNAQDTFDTLIRHADVLLDDRVWSCCYIIPDHLWTQRHFTHFVNICLLDEMSIEQRIWTIQRYVNEVILRGHHDRQTFNPSQSTHTASVHESVSESATRLSERYRLTAKQPIKALKEWGASLVDTDLKTLAAKRAITRITANGFDAFTDHTSGVSMQQLLALAWTAMNDVDNLVAGTSAQEAKNRFLQCLYEIQRGYNIDEQGNDDHQDDKPICTAGTFNKLIEALSGVHRDCQIIMLSMPQAYAKLPIIVREEALKYIQENNDTNKDEYSQQLEQHGLMMIITAGITLWDAIKAKVIARVKDEFGFLFKDDKALEAFVDNGKETNCQLLQHALSNAGLQHRFFQPQPEETSSSSSSSLSLH